MYLSIYVLYSFSYVLIISLSIYNTFMFIFIYSFTYQFIHLLVSLFYCRWRVTCTVFVQFIRFQVHIQNNKIIQGNSIEHLSPVTWSLAIWVRVGWVILSGPKMDPKIALWVHCLAFLKCHLNVQCPPMVQIIVHQIDLLQWRTKSSAPPSCSFI